MTEAGEQAPDFRGFWSWFAEHESEILEIMAGQRDGRVTELLDGALERFGINIAYDVTEGTFGGELTFTPEGDPAMAPTVDQFVAQAPSFDTWVIHSRRQRKALSTAMAFVKALHGVDLTGLHFQVRSLDGVYHLRFLSDALMSLDEDARYAVAATFLDHALGEAVAMNYVGSLDFKPHAEGIEAALVVNQIIRETGGMPATPSTDDLPQVAR